MEVHQAPHPWDPPGKNTGVGCHFLLQCMKVKSESEVAQLCLTLSDSKDCSPPGSSVHGVFQARVLEWVAIAFSEIQTTIFKIEKQQSLTAYDGESYSIYYNKSQWKKNIYITSVQFSSVAQLCPTLCDSMDCSTPGFPVHHQLPEFIQTHIHQVSDPSNHLILCGTLLLLPSIFPSIRVFSNESVLHIRWPKYWSFSFSISASNEYSVLITYVYV